MFPVLLPNPLEVGSAPCRAGLSPPLALLLRRALCAQTHSRRLHASLIILRASWRTQELRPVLRFRRERLQLQARLQHILQTPQSLGSSQEPFLPSTPPLCVPSHLHKVSPRACSVHGLATPCALYLLPFGASASHGRLRTSPCHLVSPLVHATYCPASGCQSKKPQPLSHMGEVGPFSGGFSDSSWDIQH